MSGNAGGGEFPVGHAATCNRGVVAAIADDQFFVLQGNVRPLARRDQVGARGLQRRAGRLLVAGQHHLDVGIAQGAGGMHGAQCSDDDHHAALVVGDAGTGRAFAVADEALERRIRLEHGVQVADHQDPLAASVTRVGGDQVAGASGSAHVDPLHVEAQRLQLRAHHSADRGDPGNVERARVLVDQLLQQGDRMWLVGVDGGTHPLLARGRRGAKAGCGGQDQQQAMCKDAGTDHRAGSGTGSRDHNPARMPRAL